VIEKPTPAATIVISVDAVFANTIFQFVLFAVPFVFKHADVTRS
jgi:hypothetical protein